MGLIKKGWYGMFFACEVWCIADVSSVSLSVCSGEGLLFKLSAIHQNPQKQDTPYQPLLIKSMISFSIFQHRKTAFVKTNNK